MTHKERALNKLKLELSKDIEQAKEMAQNCGILELLWFVYNLHWLRLLPDFPNAAKLNPEVVKAYSTVTEEAVKYIISLITKYGNWGFTYKKGTDQPLINLKLVQVFLKHGNYINSKYESESMIQLFDVEVSGERDQYSKIDMSSMKTDIEVAKVFNYSLRVDYDNNIKKSAPKKQEILLNDFKTEYVDVSDLFEAELGITLDEFCDFINTLTHLIIKRLQDREERFAYLSNGNVDIQAFQTFINFSTTLLFDRQKLLQQFDKKFHLIFDRLTFDIQNFDETQLRFHLITRKPIIVHKDIVVLSAELLLDSIFTNTHYSLLESEQTKHEYNKRKADHFLDKIVQVAQNYGYNEVSRNLELYEGKNQIGDIDLILANNEGRSLLIEAKNHALPMDIYFKDVVKMKEHLKYLQEKWEAKVAKRKEHLHTNYEKYGIPKHHFYMVVSKFPEIISHYSPLLILSIQEFETWLNKFPEITLFEEFHKVYYDAMSYKFNAEELHELEEAKLFFGRMAKG